MSVECAENPVQARHPHRHAESRIDGVLDHLFEHGIWIIGKRGTDEMRWANPGGESQPGRGLELVVNEFGDLAA